jgi:hypothetical protein
MAFEDADACPSPHDCTGLLRFQFPKQTLLLEALKRSAIQSHIKAITDMNMNGVSHRVTLVRRFVLLVHGRHDNVHGRFIEWRRFFFIPLFSYIVIMIIIIHDLRLLRIDHNGSAVVVRRLLVLLWLLVRIVWWW